MDRDFFFVQFPIRKAKSILCGNACFDVVLRYYKKQESTSVRPILWIADLANLLLQYSIDNILFCGTESRLLSDYRKVSVQQKHFAFSGFSALRDYEYSGNHIDVGDVGLSRIDQHLETGISVLLVQSSVWNHDSSMKGSHFIVLLKDYGDHYLLANPRKRDVVLATASKRHVFESFQAASSWGIFC